ncbi:hypothetical protein B0O99DRAFT_747604 [Bisporella sp. PMI_857]|nr:hypothetical protein B0O99DRAFT_747604 [Bisporella sp. PMI_857]
MASTEPSNFEGILASFKKRLTSEHAELFQLTTFGDLKESITRIQKEQAAKKGLRNLNKIKPFLNGLKQYAEVLQVFIQVKPEILAFIWGPVKLCIQIASTLNEAFDALLDAYEGIGNSLPILSTVDALFYNHPHVKQVLADIYEDILDFHKRAIVFFKHGTWKLTFKLTYHTFSDMFGDILKKLDRSRDLVLQSANLAHFQDSQEARIRFSKEMEVLLDEKQNQRRIAIMDWLSAEPGSKIQHQELRKVRAMLPQTTRWIFSQPQMLGWLKRTDYAPCTFWLCGIPGAGKTVIFSSVVDEISTTLPDAQVVYFYCKNNDPLRSHFTDLAKSLISQILQLNPNCLDFIYESMLAGGERRAKDAWKLLHILNQILTNHDSLYIGIDGLDECSEEERKLFSNLVTACTKANDAQGNVRIIVTSRQERDLERSLKSAVKFNIKPRNIENDITAYITFKMAMLSRIFKFTPEREQSITKEICTRPKGMFLLARLIMDNLLSQDNLEDLNEELRFEVLPHGINEAYGRMLVRIGKASSKNPSQLEKCLKRAKLILTLITTSQRALYVHEIQGALAINLEEKNVDFGNRHSRFPLDDLCGPIIQVLKNGIVDLIHPTAKEYLWQHHSGYYIKASGAEELMTTLCASYLTFDCFSLGLAKDRFTARVLSGDLAFQEYAACNWLKHLECLFRTTDTETVIPRSLQKAILILQERHGIQSACSSGLQSSLLCKADFGRILIELQQLYDQIDTIIVEDSETQGRMPYLLAQICHSRLVIEGRVIQGTEQDHLENFSGKSPFRCPVLQCPYFVAGFINQKEREKHFDSHRRLFMCPYSTCDYSILGLPSDSALKTHVSLCHEDLPKTPVFPDIKARTLEQALEDAIAANNLLAITDLANELASFPKKKGGFVLQALTLGYRKAALTLLDLLGTPSELDHVHKKSVAILKACEIGDEEIFDILVEKGANINITSGEGALTVASQNCHLSIARKLLDHKDYLRENSHADYAMKGALAMASTYGHAEAVSLLLEKDSKYFIKKIPVDFNRALNASIKGKHVQCAKLLLNWALEEAPSVLPTKVRNISRENVDHMIEILSMEQAKIIKQDGGTKGNALQAKARKGDCGAVLHLLDLGADIDNLTGEYGTPVMAAASAGKLEMIHLLIERGADFKKKDDREKGSGGSAIDVAAAHCQETVVRALLDKGAVLAHESVHYICYNTFTASYGEHTAVQALSRRADSAALIRLLLERGANGAKGGVVADTNRNRELRRPLQLAVEYGGDATLQVLLEYDVDINAKDGEGGTALQQAVRNGKSDILEILLDHGADINAVNAKGETALIVGTKCYPCEKYQHGFRILVERGADTEMVDEDGNTALMVASKNYDQPLGTIQLLVEKGADISTVNFKGLTALMMAADCGNDLIVNFLLQHRTSQHIEENGEVWGAMELAIKNSHVRAVRVLLESLIETATTDHLFSPTLSLKLSNEVVDPDMISLLKEYGVITDLAAHETGVSP